jgi:hypothetical protein
VRRRPAEVVAGAVAVVLKVDGHVVLRSALAFGVRRSAYPVSGP